MYNTQRIIERLKALLQSDEHSKVVTDKQLASMLGLTPAYFSRCKKENNVPFEKIAGLCFQKRFDLNYVLFGKEHEPLSKDDTQTVNNTVQVRLLSEVYGSCGGGGEDVNLESQWLTVDKRAFGGLRKEIDYANLQAITATGDSMEPLIKEGSIVFIDTGDTNANKSGVFTISTNEGVFIKRLNKTVEGAIELISENTVYSKQEISPDEIRVNGRVIGLLERI